MWVRGLKLCDGSSLYADVVAPYVGAWIETYVFIIAFYLLCVAPYVGAWIETFGSDNPWHHQQVAPYVGAWIETLVDYASANNSSSSHPMWVRGLKPQIRDFVGSDPSRTLCGCVD